MQPIVINRRYYDEYFFDLSHKCANIINFPVIYENLTKNWIDIVSKNKTSYLVIFPDYLTDGIGYCTFSENELNILKNIDRIIFVVSSVQHAHLDFDFPNIIWLHAGSDMLFQKLQYVELEPVIQKSFSKHWHYVSLSLIPRPHRLLATSVLLALYEKTGYITVNCLSHNNETWQDYFCYDSKINHIQTEILQKGWTKTLKHTNPQQTSYPQHANHNALNFNLRLRPIYENTAIEIINETTFFNNGVFVSEKYLNSVYGKNFPIFVSNAGTVSYLRDNGFDLFDDIVDHSYDQEQDPLERIFKAFSLNAELLQNRQYAIDKWFSCKSRFEVNLYWAKTLMYQNFSYKLLNQISNFN